MSHQQFSENELGPPVQPIRSDSPERMTEDETRAVIELWQARQDASVLSALPSVPDVAEGLGITPQEAGRLLSEVREQRQARNFQRPIETLDEPSVELGRAIEAGRLAAQREQIHTEPPTQEMREVDAMISVGRIGSEYLSGRFSKSWIIALFLMGIIFIAAFVLFIHAIR